MAKRKFTALMSLSVATLAMSINVRADQSFVGTDGCAVLAQVVYSEVTAAVWGTPGVASPSAGNAFRTDISICNRTAQTVSQAFSVAMASIGSPVRWPAPPNDPGDRCLSIHLDQCYPGRTRLGGNSLMWNALSDTIRIAMPEGTASDRSIFIEGAMRMALRSAMLRGRQIP
ncbi:MAG: hypothetical protein ACR2QZ_03185 [Woeseiaceae bacterium]